MLSFFFPHLADLPAVNNGAVPIAGKGMFSRIGRSTDGEAADEQWLGELQSVDLPPVDTLLHSCLIQPIQEQVHTHSYTNTPHKTPEIHLLLHDDVEQACPGWLLYLFSGCLFPSRQKPVLENRDTHSMVHLSFSRL